MMPDLGKYASSVNSAYLISLLLLAALVLVILKRGKLARARLDAVERQERKDGQA
ncbi:MAG: heme exporter protein CcmD [Roseobacter sp.]